MRKAINALVTVSVIAFASVTFASDPKCSHRSGLDIRSSTAFKPEKQTRNTPSTVRSVRSTK